MPRGISSGDRCRQTRLPLCSSRLLSAKPASLTSRRPASTIFLCTVRSIERRDRLGAILLNPGQNFHCGLAVLLS